MTDNQHPPKNLRSKNDLQPRTSTIRRKRSSDTIYGHTCVIMEICGRPNTFTFTVHYCLFHLLQTSDKYRRSYNYLKNRGFNFIVTEKPL